MIYEAHVRGLTRLHPDLPPETRGTFRGLASPPMLRHFRRLGVTTVEILPIHRFVDDAYLADRGLTNYWGYNTLSSTPAPTRRSRCRDSEFQYTPGSTILTTIVFTPPHTARGKPTLPPTFFNARITTQQHRRCRLIINYVQCNKHAAIIIIYLSLSLSLSLSPPPPPAADSFTKSSFSSLD